MAVVFLKYPDLHVLIVVFTSQYEFNGQSSQVPSSAFKTLPGIHVAALVSSAHVSAPVVHGEAPHVPAALKKYPPLHYVHIKASEQDAQLVPQEAHLYSSAL